MAEFQAIILAGGPGMGFFPFIEDEDESSIPNVGGRPFLSYQLSLLEDSGFSEAIVVTTETSFSQYSKYIKHDYEGKIMVELCSVDDSLETADVLRHIEGKIKSNFIVIAGDLVTDVAIHHLADIHRIQNAAVTMLLKEEDVEDNGRNTNKKKKGYSNQRDEHTIDCIGLVESENRIIHMTPSVFSDFSSISIPRALLKRRGNISIRTNVIDVHFYVFSRWVLDLLEEKPRLVSIKADLIPHLVRRQFRGLKIFSESLQDSILNQTYQQPLALSMSTSNPQGNPCNSDSSSADVMKCCTYLVNLNKGYCERPETKEHIKKMNREISKKCTISPKLSKTKQSQSSS